MIMLMLILMLMLMAATNISERKRAYNLPEKDIRKQKYWHRNFFVLPNKLA